MPDSPKTRVSLILKLKQSQDAQAWHEFVEIYQPLIFRIAKQKGLQEADAWDLTQDVLTRVAKSVQSFDPDPKRGSFRGWLGQITRNLVVDFLRGKSRRAITSDDTLVRELIEQTPDASAETGLFDLEFERQVFAWAAEKIKPTFTDATWQCFWLTAVEQQPVNVVAKSQNVSRGAVYIARSRVMAKLKRTIQNSPFDSRFSEESS